jgi:YbgC/YbaW family acyl-CoA thioester hydrolase
MRVFTTELQVRGYELDGYGHVNHAVYLNYAEFARWRMVEDATGGSQYFTKLGIAPVIVRAEADYHEPCFLAEWLVIETHVQELRKRVVKFSQKIKKRDSGRTACEVLVTGVVIDANGRPVSFPADFAAAFGSGKAKE